MSASPISAVRIANAYLSICRSVEGAFTCARPVFRLFSSKKFAGWNNRSQWNSWFYEEVRLLAQAVSGLEAVKALKRARGNRLAARNGCDTQGRDFGASSTSAPDAYVDAVELCALRMAERCRHIDRRLSDIKKGARKGEKRRVDPMDSIERKSSPQSTPCEKAPSQPQ